MKARLDVTPETTVTRKQPVEHPFGTFKMRMGATHLLMKRNKNSITELSLYIPTYNLNRMLSIAAVQNANSHLGRIMASGLLIRL
jgi:hypothetical protein